jgi:TPR repeat protein
LLETAANAGSWNASLVLGILARDGNGEPKDAAAAYYHFQIAVLQGGESAKRKLAQDLTGLAAKLTEERRRDLVSSANTWFHARPVALEFIALDAKDRKHNPGSSRTAEDDAVYSGELLSEPPA